jgi:hypothetical protein
MRDRMVQKTGGEAFGRQRIRNESGDILELSRKLWSYDDDPLCAS